MEVVDTYPVIKKKPCYCGPPGIVFGDRIRRAYPVWPVRPEIHRHLYYTHKGRCGLGLLCKHWNLTAGDEILMPAYNCGSEVDPFLYYKLNVIFYRVDLSADIDREDIFRRITKKTKVIYIIHYFGWPQNIKELLDFCRCNNIYLIEECALSLFSNPVEHPIGVLGDAAIYSFPKTLPVPDGGALTILQDSLSEAPVQRPPIGGIFYKFLPLIKRTVLRICDNIGLYSYLPNRLIQSRRCSTPLTTPAGLPEIPQSYYYDRNIQNMTASAITRCILEHTCPESVVKQRRENYSRLFEAVEKSELFKPLYRDLPEGVCPLYLPVLTVNRRRVCLRLNEMGIAAGQWWAGFHRGFDWAEFSEAKYLKDHVLMIPVHPQLTRKNLDYISDCLKKRIDLMDEVSG